jgi:RNA polymerase sigma-70 factor, ECF subfamily
LNNNFASARQSEKNDDSARWNGSSGRAPRAWSRAASPPSAPVAFSRKSRFHGARLGSSPLEMESDHEINRSARQSFEREVLPHLDSIYSMARRLARNPEDANDLLQDTVLRAYRFFDQFIPGTNSRAWVLTILFNIFRNGYRKGRREQVSQSEAEFTERLEAESLASDQTRSDPEALAFVSVMSPEVTAALDSIPAAFRTALLLIDFQELSYQEASEVLLVPVGTVKSRVSRGRSLLRVSLFNFARGEGILRC